MKNFVISLKSAENRRKHIRNEFDKKSIHFSFFDAVTINQLDDIQKKLDIDLSLSNLTDLEKACFLSHVSLWVELLEGNEKFITIFEDDVVLSNRNVKFFLENNEWIPNHLDILKIEFFSNKAFMDLRRHRVNQRSIRQLRGIHLGAAGYFINKKSAIILIDYIRSKKNHLPIDHILFDEFICSSRIKIGQLNPALCAQSDRILDCKFKLDSQLEQDRKIRQEKSKKSSKVSLALHLKFIREIKRFFFQIRQLFDIIYFK